MQTRSRFGSTSRAQGIDALSRSQAPLDSLPAVVCRKSEGTVVVEPLQRGLRAGDRPENCGLAAECFNQSALKTLNAELSGLPVEVTTNELIVFSWGPCVHPFHLHVPMGNPMGKSDMFSILPYL